MELSWTTFFLEIINFIVLVWILQHFLYKPIKKAITTRRDAIEKTVQDAEQTKKAAQDLQAKYENRLHDWEHEKVEAQKKFDLLMADEKSTQLEKLHTQLAQEEQKFLVTEQKELADFLAKRDSEALKQGMRFATKFLTRMADVSLQDKIIQLFLEDLALLSAERIAKVRKECNGSEIKCKTISALPLSEQQQKLIVGKFQELFACNIAFTFLVNPDLLAGIKVIIGALVLDADLCDELKFFAEVTSG
jgi:F-type H+-transporting ATPase subunit b